MDGWKDGWVGARVPGQDQPKTKSKMISGVIRGHNSAGMEQTGVGEWRGWVAGWARTMIMPFCSRDGITRRSMID